MSALSAADRLTWGLRLLSVCGIGQMQMSFTDMLSLDCTNKGRVAKGGNIHLSKVRSWQANVIAFDDTALNEWLMQASPTALTKAAVIAYAEGCFW